LDLQEKVPISINYLHQVDQMEQRRWKTQKGSDIIEALT